VEARKREALQVHASQNPKGATYAEQELMRRFRGMQSGSAFAEAFVRHEFGSDEGLPAAADPRL
jgi:hypothetical protein